MKSNQKKPPTIKDVAEKAGVSVGTVSRVLAKEVAVKAALRERVNQAMAELDYRVNIAARALRTNQIDVIGLILPDITNPFFSQLAKSIELQAVKRDHSVMLASSQGDSVIERSHVRAFLDRSVRGIVVIAATDNDFSESQSDVPIVSLDRRLGRYPLIATDHERGAALIADHLYGLGHRHIAYIAGPQDTEVGRLRKAGFVNRIKHLSAKGERVKLRIHHGKFDYGSGEQIARKLLKTTAGTQITAIAAASDQLAIGALRVARDLGLQVPADISITGFDDIDLAALVVPRLTTIRQQTDLLAECAMDMVFGSINKSRIKTIEGELVVRDSTAEARQ
ncbi:LacI family DNA-binding transcriptional regulator [Granulosicoccus antarcticus]|uniref:LacI family DNA-binding transcriptional regulator n=1 Tax=Granulosicoccus antarcticus TaxID=437505 RepID=UPI00197AF05B|nr:LacI family DNA-binding transcriptional regulator [Granulosicoccus antarcticus]